MPRLRHATPPVLVVEDDPVTRELYGVALKTAGFNVRTARDGLEALIAVEEERPSAIVLDLGLPRLNGSDLRKELASRADTRTIPVVVVTGSDTAAHDVDGVECVLRKPVDPEALVKALARCLRVSKL